jgi:hypothetical protein
MYTSIVIDSQTVLSLILEMIHLLNAERLIDEWPNIEWPNTERPNTEWPNTEWPNTELDPMPNRDPTFNDRTPNDPTPKGTERRIGLNTESEHRKTKRRKLLHSQYYP